MAAYHLYDGVYLPFDACSFDAVASINTLYFWDEPAILMAEICRVLKTGGRLSISFCPKAFMQTLSFSAHDFTLYDSDALLALTQSLPLDCVQQTKHQDIAVDKSGQLVARSYLQMCFVKI